jgi:hypothetical protein
MDNKVNIRISNQNASKFVDETINDIICYSDNSNNAFHIGIADTSNYLTIDNDITSVHNNVTISKNLIVHGDLLNAEGDSYSVGQLVDSAIKSHHIANSNITREKLDTNSIDTYAIIDQAVTASKLGYACVSLSNVNTDVLLAENIEPGVFGVSSDSRQFTFQNMVNFKNGIYCTNSIDQNTYVKLMSLGSPYVIETLGDDPGGQSMKLLNNRTVYGNKKTNEYSTEINEHAMLAMFMPNLIENGENRIKVGKNPYMCLHLEYVCKNIQANNCDSAKMQLFSNTVLGSTGDSPYIQLTSSGIGINTPSPESTFHCVGDIKLEGDVEITANYVYSGSNISMPGSTSLIFEESKVNFTTISDVDVYSDNIVIRSLDSNSILQIENGNKVNINTPLSIYSSNTHVFECIADNNPLLETIFKSLVAINSGNESSSHYISYYGDDVVFKVDRGGNITGNSLSSSRILINSDSPSDDGDILSVGGNVTVTGTYKGDGGGLTNLQASSIVGRVSIDNIEAIYSSNITNAIKGEQIEGGSFGIVNGNNITNLNASNLEGIYSRNAMFSMTGPYKSYDGFDRLMFQESATTHIYAPTDIHLACQGKIYFNSNAYIDNFITQQFVCPSITCLSNVLATSFEGDGSKLKNIRASNIIGGVSNIMFPPGVFQTTDSIDRFNFNTNYTTIYSPDKLYFNSGYTYVEKAGNIVIKTSTGNDVVENENIHEIGNDNLGNVISCVTAINGYSEQNISDPSIERRGTISLRHPNASNNNIRAITISHGSQNTVTSYITSSGYIYGEGIYYTSDERVKSDIIPIDGASDVLSRLKPKSYNKWHGFSRDTESTYESGLIAQDVYMDVPELRHIIEISPDADVDNGMWGSSKARINYQGIIPYLIAAINEQNAIIKDLRKEILSVK